MADQIIPPRRGEFLTPEGVATTRFNEYLERMTSLTNTVSDNTENIDSINQGSAAQSHQSKQIDNLALVNSVNQNAAAIASLNKKIEDLQLLIDLGQNLSGFAKKLSVIAVSADYTSVGNEIIICTNTTPITITLSSTANNLDEVHVKRQNTGLVTVAGAVDGGTTFNILSRYDAPSMVYTADAAEYSIL